MQINFPPISAKEQLKVHLLKLIDRVTLKHIKPYQRLPINLTSQRENTQKENLQIITSDKM